MPCTVVILQPMFIPWLGLFEQIKLSDIYVHYDDVQLPQGRSFTARVQIKSNSGIAWLTAPVDRVHSGHLINETLLINDTRWRNKHMKSLQHWYARAPFRDTMLRIAKEVYSYETNNLAEFNRHAIEFISEWLGLKPRFLCSSELGIEGSSTKRLVDLCKYCGADIYVTGLGALNYLDYKQFEDSGILVQYMNYEKRMYPQLNGTFTPYVSILDAIANCGELAAELLCSQAVYWKDYIGYE